MGYYTLRNFAEPLLPTGDEEHLSSLEAEARGGNSLVNSFKMSRISNEMSLLADEESQLRTSNDPDKQEAARLLRSRIRTLRDESGAFATAPQRYEDVHGLGDAGSYIAGQVGQAVGSSIDQMATGSAMGIASGVAGLIPHPAAQAVAWGLRGAAPLELYRQNKNLLTGEAYNEIADDPVAMQRSAQDIRDEVSQHGYRAALLDTATQLLPVGQISGVAGKALGRIPTSAKLFGSAVGEGLTETAQQYSQQQAHSTLNPERDMTGDMSELINSGLGGFVGGGAMGSIGHVGEKMWARGRTEGDGQNGDVIDLNAPTTETKPEVTLNPVEALRGKPGKFNDRESQLALIDALEGNLSDENATPDDFITAAQNRKNLLVEHLGKIRGQDAKDLLSLIEGTPVEDGNDALGTLDNAAFDEATALIKKKLKLSDGTKRNAEEPYLEGFGGIPGDAVDKIVGYDEKPKYEGQIDARAPQSKTGPIDSADFTFDPTPDMFADLQPEAGAPRGNINDRSAANKARYEEAQQKAKLFSTRSGLVANRLWKAYTTEHGFGVEDGERVRRDDPGAVDNIRKLTSEIMAISTVDTPTPAEERRADRVARELVDLIGDRASEQLADIWRITGGSKFLRYASDEAARYARTDRNSLQAQFDDRDAAAQELVKIIPAEVEARLLKEHGIDLSSNKDRNDILDLMEDVADGRTSVPRIKLTKLFTKNVVDAMEGYLGNTIMPRMAGVREEHIDENDSSGGMTQATNADGVHDTEATAADFRDIAEDGADEVDDFEAGAAEKNHSAVTPESMVYHWAGSKKATVKDFTKAWDRNDEGRLPKLLHPGDDKMLERVQTLAGLAAERLGDQRDRYVIGNPLAKDPIEAAGGTSAKKLMDRAGMSDDKRTQLMLEYMQQEGKTEVPAEALHALENLQEAERASTYLGNVLGKRESLSPSGETLSVEQNAALNPTRSALNAMLSIAKKSSKYPELAAMSDLSARMSAMKPIIDRAVETAREDLARNVPGFKEFIAENPGAELKDFVNNYFSQRYAVVAEQPTDRDYLQLSPTEFKDMATRGAKALKSVYNDVGTDEAAQTVARAGRNVIHFESPHSKSGTVSIPTHALVEWVRNGRNAHTKDKNIGEASRGSQRSQHDSYRDDLGEGISALTQNGLVTGLPWIVNKDGQREDFVPSTPRERTGATDDFGNLIRPMQRSESRQITDNFGKVRTVDDFDKVRTIDGKPVAYRKRPKGERIPVVSEDFGDHKISKTQNYFITEKGHAVKDGWKRAGVGELPPSLDLDGISVKEYNEQRGKKAYAQKMQTRADANAKSELRAGMTPEQRDQFDRNEYAEKRIKERREEARKNKELSQDPVDVQGEEAVDEAMRISEGSQTRKDEREHIQLMTTVMRAAADHLPGALTVKGAVNKAASVAGNVWKTYMADPEAGLARMAGYIRSIARGKHSGDYEGQKAFREIWNEYHALETPEPAPQRGWGRTENKEFAKRLAENNPNVDVNHLELLGEDVQDKTWNPNLAGAVDRDPKVNPRKDNALKTVQTAAQHPALVNAEASAVGGPHYALPLAAVLTPRNLEAARPQDKSLLLDMRARVAATIQALWADGKIDSGQVRKLINHLSGFTDATLREKQDKRVPPNGMAQIERRNAAKVTEEFIPNAKVRDFLNGLVKGGNAATELQDPGTGFEGGRYYTAADPVGGDKTKPLPVGDPVRGQGSTLAEREAAAAAAPAVGVAGGRATVKNLSLDYKGGTVDHDAEIAALEAEYTARGITKARNVETKEPSKVETKEPSQPVGITTVREHPDSGFRQRTIDNVSAAGVTVAIATDFTTAGERLTRNTADAQGKYLALDFSLPADKAGLRLAKTMRSKDTTTLNVAGNGIYTLVKSGHTQESVNRHVYDIIAAAHALRPITKIVSGGQTGVDIAGAVAARALGIPSVITLPKGYRQRNANNQDVTLTNADIRKQIVDGVDGLGTKEPSKVSSPKMGVSPSLGYTPKADLSMNYADGHGGDHHMRSEFAGKSTMDLIESGDRTATTRSLTGFKGLKKGDVFTVTGGGRSVLLRATTDPYRTSEVTPKEWSQLEGWAPSVYGKYNSAWQMRFERVDGGEKHTPSSPIQAPGATTAASEGVGSQNTLQAAIAKHQEYLKNPPEDYTTERAAAIGTWAERQRERVRERAKTDQSDELQDMIDDLSRLAKQSAELVAADKHLEEKLGPQGSVKRNAEVYSGKLADKPIFTDFAEASKEDQALVEKLDASIGSPKEGRRRILSPERPNAETDRAGRIAARIEKRVVWVENLGTDGVSVPSIPGIIFLDPSSNRSVQVLAAHELAHSLKRDAPAAYDRLADELGYYVDPEEWDAFSQRQDDITDRAGVPRLSEEGKIEEMVANLLSDYAYRSHEAAAKAEYEARGGGFTGYGGYLREGTQGKVDAALERFLAAHGQSSKTFRNAEALTMEEFEAQFDQLSKMSSPPPKHIQVTSAIKHFERTLGDKVNLILKDSFPDMKIGSADYNLATNVARVSTANPLRILRLAYHESVHGMFNTILNAKGMEATKEMLYRAASEPMMYARLKQELKGHTKALKDMENDMEERVAYMFQFWKLDMLTIDKKPETFFEKVQAMMRRVFGAVRDSEKALALLTAFDEGGLKEPSAAGQVIAKIMGQGEWHKKLLARFDAQSQALYTEVMAAHNVFRTSESATAQKLGKLFYTNPGYGADAERVNGVQEGMINRTQFKRNYYSNRIRDALKPLQGANVDRDLKTLAEALNAHTEPTSELVRTAKDAIGKVLNEFRGYAKSNGLDLGKQLGADKRYWPRVYEIENLINGKEEFTGMLLTRHGKLMRTIASTMRDSGKYPGATEQDAADAIHQSLVDRLGVEDSKLDAERDDGVLSPYFASQNERKLDWLSDEDVKPFLSTDVIGTLTQYISQGVRAVEYTKMFGERGQSLKEMLARKGDLNFVTYEGKPVFFQKDGPILRELKEAAADQKIPEKDKDAWVERRFEDLKRASGAMEGSLGKDISAGYRKLQAGLMTYQILRLLPLMIFSSMLDPNGIRVAGGDWDDMFAAYKRGFVGLWHNWKDLFLGNPFGSREPDDLEMAALAAGVINSDAINEEMGEVHSSEYSSGMSRRVNHAFFKAIGITQWDRDMRIMATAAARKAIVNHFNNTVPEHSARWLREVGLKRSDVHLNDKGELIVSAAELAKKLGIKPEQAQRKLEPTHFAVNRWVSRAIVSPNAGLRPTRASDPHYAMFFQFKSFTYAFQETTMRYALHEAQNGNRTAALQLLRGVPIMIAADMTKAMVTGGGSLPGYMANWTLLDWVQHGINRAGLLGTGSFATDILSGNISGTLAGPSVGQAFSVAGDLLSGDVGGAVTQSLPGVKQMNFMHG